MSQTTNALNQTTPLSADEGRCGGSAREMRFGRFAKKGGISPRITQIPLLVKAKPKQGPNGGTDGTEKAVGGNECAAKVMHTVSHTE